MRRLAFVLLRFLQDEVPTKRHLLRLTIAPVLALLVHTASGQSATALLRGVVTDATKAVVPGVEVVIISTGTAQKHAQRDTNRMDADHAVRPPADAIAEFRILTTTAPVEFGGTTTIVTRSGTNKFHGTMYELLRNDVLNANNYFAPRKERMKQNQFGGTAGGPIVHNHAYFFAYYEGLRNIQDIAHGVVVPTVA